MVYQNLKNITEEKEYWDKYIKFHELYWDGPNASQNVFYGNEYSGAQGRCGLLAGNSGNSNGYIYFNTGGSERLRITSTGKVGINETSPDNMLHGRSDNTAAAKIGGEGGSAYYMEIGQM